MSSDGEATARLRAAIEDHQRLVTFVHARLGEVEQRAVTAQDGRDDESARYEWEDLPDAAFAHARNLDPDRTLRWVMAASAVLTAYEMSVRMLGEGLSRDKMMLVRAHAVIWEDHPDYDPAWSPA